MLFPAGGMGKYDPQIIKPPADYRGSDSMDYEAAKNKKTDDATSATAKGVEVEIAKA